MNKYFYEIFENIPRQGPGMKESTLKAFQFLKNLPSRPEILDIGCGKGVQTLELAEISDAQITAVDNHSFFLDHLTREVNKLGLGKRIKCVCADMKELPFNDNSYDIIWSEGAVFIIGIAEGLRLWKRLIKPRGYLVFSEMVWFSTDQPAEAAEYWKIEYPAMTTVTEVIKTATALGYNTLGHFTLPAKAWKEHFFKPIEETIKQLEMKNSGDAEAANMYKYIRTENEYILKYLDYCGYEFFIFQK